MSDISFVNVYVLKIANIPLLGVEYVKVLFYQTSSILNFVPLYLIIVMYFN